MRERLIELLKEANSNGRGRMDSRDWEAEDLAELIAELDTILADEGAE